LYRKLVLDNGVRVVTERMPTLKSVTVGVWVNTGSRDEQPSQAGYSHFIEHMLFKGTRKRSSAEISREIDALGGEMNAFTSRETTTYYVKVLDQQLERALDLLADLFHHSRFAHKEVEKEKQVVLEEIRMVRDDPEDLVQELHSGQVLGRHPLGRPILGREKTIRGLRRQDLLHYIETYYDPGQTVVSIAGNFDQAHLDSMVVRYFGKGRWAKANHIHNKGRYPPAVHGGVLLKKKRLEQVHLCLGLNGIAAGHKDRYALYALNSVLGGSVSSRLFQEIREKRGLAYSIYSFLSGYSDGGMITVYAATRPKEVDRVVDLVCREIRRIGSKGVERKELERAKTQMKGSLMLSLESSHSRMSKLAKDELTHGGHMSLEDMLSHIDCVNEEQAFNVSRQFFKLDALAITGLGPLASRSLQHHDKNSLM
jgi:predicted Zn-dependent peptidase